MARVALCSAPTGRMGWTVDDLAKKSRVNRRSILIFENGGAVLPRTVEKLRTALEAEGLVFIEKGVYLGGVVPPKAGPRP